MQKKQQILVTRSLSDKQIEFAENLGLDVVIEPAIEISYRTDWFAVETILKTVKKPVLAFTSRHGVRAFEQFQQSGPKLPEDTPVYAVGKKTALELKKSGWNAIVPEQKNGSGLAHKITDDLQETSELADVTILHFCGDKRRDEFRQFLQDSGIKTRDIVAYETVLNSMNLPNIQFDGILFYSPSAVQAFRSSGGFINPAMPELFAIGSTTAEELSVETGKHVHVSPEPDTETFLTFVANVLSESS